MTKRIRRSNASKAHQTQSNTVDVTNYSPLDKNALQSLLDEQYMRGANAASVQQMSRRSFNDIQTANTEAFNVLARNPRDVLMDSLFGTTKDKNSYNVIKDIQTSRLLADTNTTMARYLQLACARMNGASGPKLLSKMSYNGFQDGKYTKILDELATSLVADGWAEYENAYNIDVAQLRSWTDFMVEDVGNGLPRDGSILWLVHSYTPIPEYSGDRPNNKFGVSLQQFDTLMIARNLHATLTEMTGIGRRSIKSGVELDQYGKHTAIYLDFTQNIFELVGGESVKNISISKQMGSAGKHNSYIRVPIFNERKYQEEGLFAIYYDNDPSPLPNQVGGRPWAAPAHVEIYSDKELDLYLLTAARAGASKALTVESTGDNGLPPQNILANAAGGSDVVLAPGMVNFLKNNQKITTIDFDLPYDGTLRFSTKIAQAVAATMAVPYAELTGDYNQSSFSSEKSGDLRNNRLWNARRLHVAKNLLEPFVRFWLCRAAINGVFSYKAGGKDVAFDIQRMIDMKDCLTWQFDAFEHQDVLAMEQASQLRLQNGTSTVTDEILRSGKDPIEVFAARRNEMKELEELGIKIEGYNFNGKASDAEAKIQSAQINADSQLAIQKLQAGVTESNAKVASELTNIKRSIDDTRNVQSMLLRNIGSIDSTLSDVHNTTLSNNSNKESTTDKLLVSLLQKQDIPMSTIKRFRATERADGTFDLNTMQIIEEPVILEAAKEEVKTETVTDTTVETTSVTTVESTEVTESTLETETKIVDNIESIIEEVKQIDNE